MTDTDTETATAPDAVTTVELGAELAAALGMPLRRFPVRRSALDRVAPEGRVHPDRLLDEADALLATDPELASAFASSLARLAVAVSARAARDGFHAAAREHAEVALGWSPDDPRVVAQVAVSRHGVDDLDGAAEAYDRVLSDPGAPHLLGLRVLAARCEMARGRPEAALGHLGPVIERVLTGTGDHGPGDEATGDAATGDAATGDEATGDAATGDADHETADRPDDELWALVATARAEAELRRSGAEVIAAGPGGATVRAAPRHDAAVVAVVPRGRLLAVDERLDGWAAVRRVDGLAGYVADPRP